MMKIIFKLKEIGLTLKIQKTIYSKNNFLYIFNFIFKKY